MNDLSNTQAALLDEVSREANTTGADSRLILQRALAEPDDKAAVAEVLGGPGAGKEFGR